MIVDELPGKARSRLVRLRCMAMRDGSTAAVELLEKYWIDTARDASVVEKVALAFLQAEILHLDGADSEAIEVFDRQITPHFPGLSTEYEIVARHNYNDLQAAAWSPKATPDFYNLVDQRRIARFDLTDSAAILGAKNAAALGKHYQALPDLWNELRRTYRQGCWRAHRWAAKDFSDECLQLGWPDEACVHAILALDEPSAKRVGEQLLALQQRDRVIKSLNWMLENATLQRHFTMACKVIAAIADAVPDDKVASVYDWASKRIVGTPLTPIELNTVREAWNVIAAIAHRLNESQALMTVDIATAHPWWKQFCVDRKTLREVVGLSVRALPPDRLKSLAQDVVGHIVDRHEDHDYAEAVNLICRIAGVGGETLKDYVASQIYVKGTKFTAVLVQVAPLFKKEAALAEGLEVWGKQVAESIPRQVQRLAPGEEAKPCNESYFSYTSNLPDGGKQIVHFVGRTALHSVLVHRHSLSPETLDAIIQSVLKLLEDGDNLLGNKTVLLEVLPRAADSVAERYAGRVFEIAAPLARGEITEPANVMSAADAANPLNPFKMGTGTPSEVQAVALYALAKIEQAKPGAYGEALETILEDALTSVHPEVREAAMAGWRDMPRLPPSVQTSIILTTRDASPRAAAAAYHTIARCEAFHPTIDELKVLYQSLAVSVRSTSVEVRRFAATACQKLTGSASTTAMESKLKSLGEKYGEDICFSVRKAISEPNH
jgi:hypothetical protein